MCYRVTSDECYKRTPITMSIHPITPVRVIGVIDENYTVF